MATKSKIQISDNALLRSEIDKLYDLTSQIDLSRWAIQCVKHVLSFSNIMGIDNSLVEQGFKKVEMWQLGQVSIHELRQVGFAIHKVARQSKSEIAKSIGRAVGHAIGVGHMREHAMVCSDYAIKTIQLAYPNDTEKITQEREWQLEELRKYNIQTKVEN